MAIGAVRGRAEFVRRETTHSSDATPRGRSAGLRPPPRASTSPLRPIRGAVGNFRDPTNQAGQPQPMRARERSKAAPRARGARDTSIPHGRLARTTATQPPAQLNEAALARGSRPFPDEEGLPAQPRLHYLATYSARAAKQALPSSSRAVAPQGSRRERRRCDLKPWAST